MTFDLKVVTIETKPKVGYWVLWNNQFCKITNIENNTVDMLPVDGDMCYKDSIENVSNKIAKLIGEVTFKSKSAKITKTYSIIHSEYDKIMQSLNNPCEYDDSIPEEKRIYKNLAEGLLKGERIYYEGVFEQIYTKTVPDDVIKLVNINIIDDLMLYDKPSRIGIVTKFNNENHTFEVVFNNVDKNTLTLTLKREDFVKVNADNIIQMIRLKCNCCHR